VGGFAAAEADAVGRVELAVADTSSLDGRVDGVDVVVCGRGDGDAVAMGRGVEPRGGDPLEVAVEGVGDDAVVGLMGRECPTVAVAELERGGSFPLLVEAVDALQLVAGPLAHSALNRPPRPTA
jgi:hypothetical protein